MYSEHIQGERKMYGQINRRQICITIYEKMPFENRFSESWFQSYDLSKIKKILKVSNLSFNAGRCTSE